MKPVTPRQAAAIIFGIVLGLGLGIGGYTFLYAKGWSYLTNDPAACANCHVMREHYDAWIKSSHRAVATCNDCHTPHNFFGKYYVKADHGFWHSYAFTTGNFHEPIQMKERSRSVTETACRNCHQEIVDAIEAIQSNGGRLSCIRCHDSVGHLM
jgi:cytochrome c nitrite reductase small subunit